MTACEKITWLEERVIDIPDAPICIGVGKELLEGAEIKLHLISGDVKFGTLSSLDGAQKNIHFISSDEQKRETLEFDKCQYVLFLSELLYIGDDAPIEFPMKIDSHTQKQPYTINFVDGESVGGDSAYTSIDDIGIHLFKVVDENYVTRLFIPKDVIVDFDVGQQIGTILKESESVTDDGLKQGLKEQQVIRNKPLGEYLKDKGIVNEADLERVLAKQKNNFEFPKVRLGELLISEGLISDQELDEALGLQTNNRQRRLGDILVDIGATTEEAVHFALAKKLGLPFIKLKEFNVNVEVLQYLPSNIAKKEKVMPLMMCGKRLVVAIPDPTQSDIRQLLGFVSNHSIEVVVSTPTDIEWAINQYYGDNFDLNIHHIESSEKFNHVEVKESGNDLEKMANERPIVRLVHNLLLEGIKRGASDIHIRPLSTGVQVLFRIHGKLILIKNFGKSLLPAIVSRIKVIARMDIAQRRLPQDGRIQITSGDDKIDMRVSTMPTIEGESVVVRILANAATLKPIEELGFNENDTNALQELLHRGAGMILVTGPTGSGKSTTLYSALNVLKQMNVNIITVEDPVEIRMDGLEQIQVAQEYDLGFGRVLRNILRHDPDVIMIGEIRDEETANIAVKAAQTGHLVLSTLHTNSAADTIIRLKEMNVDPYMIASSLLGVVAQRLITKNCENCKTVEEVSMAVRQLLGLGADEEFFIGQGCDSCGNTGISGRIPAYEFLQVSESLQQNILSDASTMELKQTAESWGMKSLVECALKNARKGDTPIADVHRILTT